MEINSDTLSGLKLINSPHINHDELIQIFEECKKDLVLTDNNVKSLLKISDDKLILLNVITFSIKSLLLEAAKHNVKEHVLVQQLRHDFCLDSDTENFKLFVQFINATLKIICHNIENFELNPLPKFENLEWSQNINIKNSIIDNDKEKSYIIDMKVDRNMGQSNEQVFSMALSSKELQDLYSTLRDCVKNVENFVNK